MTPSEPASRPRYSTVNVTTETLDRIDQARHALAADIGTLSRAAFVTAAVENYLDNLAAGGYALDAPATDQLVNLAGIKIPFRPRADWALVDTGCIPNRVSLATGNGPDGTATLTVTAEILPHLTRGRFGGWREMLRSSGYVIDEDRTLPDDQAILSDGRDIIPIRT